MPIPEPKRAAIIDIGSNSVRLVVYDVFGASILPTFNEKVMAGLGRGLAETGRLSAEGRVAGIAALERFRAILNALSVDDIAAVATAAVREAEDGPDWAKAAMECLNNQIQILSGEDEARLTALGAEGGFYRPNGVVGDLGGSSVEFKRIGTSSGTGESHFLGPLSLANLMPDLDAVRAHVRKHLEASKVLKRQSDTFYAVGGAWRSIAKLSMKMNDYPLRVLQGYELTLKQVQTVAEYCQASLKDETVKADLIDFDKKRADTLPAASIVLEEALKSGGHDRVVMSSSGLREGVLMEHLGMSPSDPLLDGVIAFARLDRTQIEFGRALATFVRPVFGKLNPVFNASRNEQRIVAATCMMADSAGRFHPDHRADMAYYQALRAPFSGLGHAERTFVAHAVGRRYASSFKRPSDFRSLNTAEQVQRAKQLGAIMRLAAVFSGRSGPILSRASLAISAGKLVLQVKKSDETMVSSPVRKRLEQSAEQLELMPAVKFTNG